MPKKDPQRKCAVTNQVADRDVLLRFVLDQDGCVTFDSGKRLPGRGIWLTPHRDVLETAVKKNAFARAAKTPARVPGDLVSKVEQQVRKTKLDRLGLARRSGALIVGTEKTRDKLRQGKLALLVLASDGSPQTTAPLIHLAGQTGTEVLVSESAETLAQALGRATAVCSGVLDARMAATILADHALHIGVGLSPDPTVAEAAS